MQRRVIYYLFSGEPRGNISIIAEEIEDTKFEVTLQLSGSKLDKKDFFGKVIINNDHLKILLFSIFSLIRTLRYQRHKKEEVLHSSTALNQS